MPNDMGPDEFEDFCSGCCCLGCTLIGHICCCRRMRAMARIQILWGWLITVGILIGVLFGVVLYSPDSPPAAPTDMRAITNNLFYVFCDSAQITSPGMDFDAYLLRTPLQIDQNKRLEYTSPASLYVDNYGYNYLAFYLLRGSDMRLNYCSESALTMYVLQGRTAFNVWKKNLYCDDCYIQRLYFQPQYDCDSEGQFQVLDLAASTDDEYYFVFSADMADGAWVNLNVQLNRSIYDLDNQVSVCSVSQSCELQLDYADQVPVFTVKGYYSLSDEHTVFTTKCVPRIWAYLMILGLGVLILGLVLSVLLRKLCKDPDLARNQLYRPRDYERAPLLPDIRPPSYQSVYLTPPKYEDIIRTDNEGLPSYSDAVGSLDAGRGDVDASNTQIRQSPVRPSSVSVTDNDAAVIDSDVMQSWDVSSRRSSVRGNGGLPNDVMDRVTTDRVVSPAQARDQLRTVPSDRPLVHTRQPSDQCPASHGVRDSHNGSERHQRPYTVVPNVSLDVPSPNNTRNTSLNVRIAPSNTADGNASHAAYDNDASGGLGPHTRRSSAP